MLRRKAFLTLGFEFVLIAVVAGILAFLSSNDTPQPVFLAALAIGVLLIIGSLVMITVYRPFSATRTRSSLEKTGLPAMAEVLVNGETLKNELLKGTGGYQGPELFLDIPVHVYPEDGSPTYDATMKAGLFYAYVLRPGVKVKAKYDGLHKERVMLFDEMVAIAQRNGLTQTPKA